jgi:hypothetical protein
MARPSPSVSGMSTQARTAESSGENEPMSKESCPYRSADITRGASPEDGDKDDAEAKSPR